MQRLQRCGLFIVKNHIRYLAADPSSLPPPDQSGTPFPSFTTLGNTSTDFSAFTKSPPLDVIASVIVRGAANSPFDKNVLDEQPEELVEGALMAMQSVTDALANREDLKEDQELSEQMTSECFQRVVELVERDQRFSSLDRKKLIATKKDDVFFAWVNAPMKHKHSGQLKIRVCTMSFPYYGELVRKVADNKERQKAFNEEMKRLASEKADVEDLKQKVREFDATLFSISPYFNSGHFVVSNWDFLQNMDDNSWQINSMAMCDAKEYMTTPFYYRWKGRISFGIRGLKFINVLRYDYATDWVVLLFLINIIVLQVV